MRKGSITTIVPKGPFAPPVTRVTRFDRDAALAKLFDLPVPPPPASRTYPIDTPLGRLMRLRKLKVRDVEKWDGAPNYRILSDYLAGRTRIQPHHRVALARGLGVDARIL